ncbi:hypothetical protein QQS21_010487 [Conoideocrella luteorostrata]|uniref:Carotenoid cleavage dioxygenase 1 n=1 Tax=Conoideocrella luteorostrata TaxID=1105319 RepID=A0AAJ0CF34_9HYPO|nr:hypothetical protein QQS21_010487 [Conoideocrella luteorostrata]
MALNETRTHLRTAQDELADMKLCEDNLLGQSWKSWPNKAAFVGLDEHRGPIELQVKGSIPDWAAGSLYRTGPGVSAIKNTKLGTHYVSHWFDGLAHTHKFDICPPATKDGTATVTYSSRRQSDDFVEHIKKTGWRGNASFGQRNDPCVGLFAKVMSYFEPRRLTNNVLLERDLPGVTSRTPARSNAESKIKNLYLATDSASIQEVNPDTLEPLGFTNQSSLHPDLKGALSCAHAQRDPETGDLYNYNLQPGPVATYRFFRVNASTGKTDILATVKDPAIGPAYIHSMFLTENYVILCIPTSHFAWKGIKILWDRQLLSAIKPFNKADSMKWIVVDRRHGKGVVARFSTPAAFFFHSVNAFEEHVYEDDVKRTDICLDYIKYESTDVLFGFFYDVILDQNGATKKYWIDDEKYKTINPSFTRQRFRLPLNRKADKAAAAAAAAATGEEVISIPGPHAGEMPVINAAYAGKPYQFVYSAGVRGLATFVDSLVKTNIHTRDALIWCGPQGHSPGEPVFVARPGATDEDDGIILSLVLDGSAETSYLLCLDAKTMIELGRAEADFPISIGLHGMHDPAVKGTS